MAFHRRIIRVTAEDSPNVRWARREQAAGLVPSDRIVLEGVVSWAQYQHHLATWDEVRQAIGLRAEFWEGADVLLFPPAWLDRANALHEGLRGKSRRARAIGIDPAEGGDRTAMAAVDEWGLIELMSRKTPNTAVITGEALAFCRKHGVPAERCVFDAGGGGKEHADRLAEQGFRCRTMGFGEGIAALPMRRLRTIRERIDEREERYAYLNRRAEVYGALRILLDPSLRGCAEYMEGVAPKGWAIPAEYHELRRQLAPMPLKWDDEGRMYMLPKHRGKGTEEKATLDKLLGCSPDEADAVVLALWGMLNKAPVSRAGAVIAG